MAPVTFSPKSRQDLLDIGDYVAKDSRANARRFVAKQTEDAFAEHLPDYPAYVLRAGRRFQDEKRITITTLQSMINIYGEYSSGYFDLIISDEAFCLFQRHSPNPGCQCYLPALAHESFSVTARLKTGAPGRESLWSATK